MSTHSNQDPSVPPSSPAGGSPGGNDPAWSETIRFSSTIVVSGDAPQAEVDSALREMERRNAVLEHCGKCDALLDVSECAPLGETECPMCRSAVIVLKEFHHFVLLNPIGRGGMGTVYRAFDRNLRRDVALKLLRNEFTNDPAYIAQLEREAQITASINHPNVVKVYSAGKENGFYYVAMEIVTGGTVSDRIRQAGRLGETTVLEIGAQAASGLNAAHLRGLLHRDVKPGNMLFSETGTVKVADFGLALPVEQAAQLSGDVWGTPYYIAPEKIRRQGENVASDIYSLGGTLFHALAGRPPFDAKSAQEVATKHVQTKAVSVQTFAPEVSGTTAAIVAQMLEKEPAKRQTDYAEVIQQLQYANDSLASGQGNLRRKVQAEMQQDKSREDQVWMWFSAACLLLLAGLGAWFLLPKKRGSEPPPAANAQAAQSASAARAARPQELPPIAGAVNSLFLEPGVYQIFNRKDRRALQDGPADADGAPVALAPSAPKELRQQWLVYPLADGLYRLASCSSGRTLEIASGREDDGAPLGASGWSGSASQRWTIEHNSGGGYRLVAKHSGKALGPGVNASPERSGVAQSPSSGSPEQIWEFVPAATPEVLPNGTYVILNYRTGRALTADPVNTGDGTSVNAYDYVSKPHQHWRLTQVGGGYCKLEAVHSGRAVNLTGTKPDYILKRLEMWTDVGEEDFRWKFEPAGNGRYKVSCKPVAGKTLSLDLENGGGPMLEDVTGAAQQLWIVAPAAAK